MQRLVNSGEIDLSLSILSIVNLAVQTIILATIWVSTAYRMKGNYKMHMGTMTFAVVLGLVFGTIGATYSFSDNSYFKTLMSQSTNFASFLAHLSVGVVTFASGVVLVAFLLADKAIPGRSNLVAKVVPALWTITYVVGVLLLLVLHVM